MIAPLTVKSVIRDEEDDVLSPQRLVQILRNCHLPELRNFTA